jgi:(2R)-ethylmalonyl-CoA mutase
VEALDSMKESLVAAHARRQRATEAGDRTVVGVNDFTQTEPSKLLETMDESAFMTVDESSEENVINAIERWRVERDASGVERALDGLRTAAEASSSLMEPSIEAAKAGVTTGEWSDTLRSVFGEYRAPTGVTQASAAPSVTTALEDVRRRVAEVSERLGTLRLRLLIAKPGLDGHSNAAEQVAVRARDAGYEVIYQGIRLTPQEIAAAAADESVNAIGVSILSGAHMSLVEALMIALEGHGIDVAKTPLVVGGVIPPSDAEKLIELGVALVFTPSDYDLTEALAKVTEAISAANP